LDKYGIPVQIGNHKLGKDTIIYNITSSTNCPSRPLGLCQIPNKCYAMKAERYNKRSLPYKQRQTEYWDNHTPYEIAKAFANITERNFKVPIKYIRISESGDFRNQNDVDKAIEMAVEMKILKPDILIYCFTARSDLDFNNRPDNLIINGSAFMLDNSFTVIPKEESGQYRYQCGGDCRVCDLCKYQNNLDIKVVEH